MAKVIGVFAEYDGSLSGPQKVLLNLLKGFELLGVPYVFNQIGDYNVCLQEWSRFLHFLPSNTLIGPNINPPWQVPHIYNKFQHFLCPSQWIYDAFSPELKPYQDLHIWPVGIDINRFKPSNTEKRHVLIYYKNQPVKKLNRILSLLNDIKVSYHILEYGKYSESEFIEAVNLAWCGILVTNTESQGIAYMEMLAMGLPLFCWDVNHFEYGPLHCYKASSAPYFNQECGIRKDDFDNEELIDFILKKYKEFNPSKYIIENHSLEQSAIQLIDIMEFLYANH